MQGFFFEALSVAFGTVGLVHEAVSPFEDRGRGVLVTLFLDDVDDAFEGHGVSGFGSVDFFGDGERLAATVEDDVEGVVRYLCDRGVEVEAVAAADDFELAEHPVVLIFAERGDAAFADGAFLVGNNLVNVDGDDGAEPVAFGAGAVGGVEAEGVRLRVLVGDACCWAHEEFAEVSDVGGAVFEHHEHSFAAAEGGLNGLCQP